MRNDLMTMSYKNFVQGYRDKLWQCKYVATIYKKCGATLYDYVCGTDNKEIFYEHINQMIKDNAEIDIIKA